MSIDIEPVIKTLNAQNQLGVKTMATILGRGVRLGEYGFCWGLVCSL